MLLLMCFSELHKYGRHMEDSIVAAYVALLLGCVVQGNSVSIHKHIILCHNYNTCMKGYHGLIVTTMPLSLLCPQYNLYLRLCKFACAATKNDMCSETSINGQNLLCEGQSPQNIGPL